MHALLIDDESSARADLREKLAMYPEVIVAGEAATISAARALLASADYDIVFLDVQLVGGESFLLFPDVRPGASVVFATAHERYAARAFEHNAVDYLLKPIDPVRLAEALRRVAAARAASGPRSRPAAPVPAGRSPDPPSPLNPLVVNGPVAFAGNSLEVALTADERVYLRQCLEAWEDSLNLTHAFHTQRVQIARLRRTVIYTRDTEPTRFFIAGVAAGSLVRRWYRSVRARFGW